MGVFANGRPPNNGQKYLGGWDWLHSQIACKEVLCMFLELFNTKICGRAWHLTYYCSNFCEICKGKRVGRDDEHGAPLFLFQSLSLLV